MEIRPRARPAHVAVGVGCQHGPVTSYDFVSPLWRWDAKDEARSGAWFFVSLPFEKLSKLALQKELDRIGRTKSAISKEPA